MIPSYLNNIGEVVYCKNNKTKVRLKCKCGCDNFLIYKRKKNDDFINLEKKTTDEFIKKYGKNFEMQSDADGNIYILRRNFLGIVSKKEIISNISFPKFYNYVSAKCSNCNNEYILFDQSIHGYDSCINNCYTNNFEPVVYDDNHYGIELYFYYNDDLYEDVQIIDKSIAFGRITIYTIFNDKKKKILDIECE